MQAPGMRDLLKFRKFLKFSSSGGNLKRSIYIIRQHFQHFFKSHFQIFFCGQIFPEISQNPTLMPGHIEPLLISSFWSTELIKKFKKMKKQQKRVFSNTAFKSYKPAGLVLPLFWKFRFLLEIFPPMLLLDHHPNAQKKTTKV